LVPAALLQVVALAAFVVHAWPRVQPLTVSSAALRQHESKAI
jgi:hypothetical protein